MAYENIEKLSALLTDKSTESISKAISSSEKQVNELLKKLTEIEAELGAKRAAAKAAEEEPPKPKRKPLRKRRRSWRRIRQRLRRKNPRRPRPFPRLLLRSPFGKRKIPRPSVPHPSAPRKELPRNGGNTVQQGKTTADPRPLSAPHITIPRRAASKTARLAPPIRPTVPKRGAATAPVPQDPAPLARVRWEHPVPRDLAPQAAQSVPRRPRRPLREGSLRLLKNSKNPTWSAAP